MDSVLVDREAERAAILRAIELGWAGQGRAIVIAGPAGAGKSRLLELARSEADAAGLAVLYARATELERDFPFAAVFHVFRSLLDARAADVRERLLTGPAALAAPLLETGMAPTGGDGGRGLVLGLSWLTANLARYAIDEEGFGGLLIGIDDLQWADPLTLRFVTELAQRLPDLPLVVAVTWRTGEPGASHDDLRKLASTPGAVNLHPGPLGREAVALLVGQRLGDVDDRMTGAVMAATAGNPFLVHELIETAGGGGVEAIEGLVPESVALSAHTRLSRLSDDARRLARAVATMGDRASLRHAAAVAGLEIEDAERALAALAASDLLVAGLELSFVHPLVRAAVTDELSAGERAGAHRRAAQILLDDGADDEIVALHALGATPVGDARIVACLRGAARTAMGHGDPAAAERFLKRATAEPPSPEQRAPIGVELAHARAMLGDVADAIARLDTACDLLGDASARARARAELGRLLWTAGDMVGAADAYERAADELPEADPLREGLRADHLAATTYSAQLRPAMIDWTRRLVSDADQGKLPREPRLLAQVAALHLSRMPVSRQALDNAQSALDAFEEGADPGDGYPLVYITAGFHYVDEYARAEPATDRLLALARSSGSLIVLGHAQQALALIRYPQGRLAEAAAHASAALEIAQTGTALYIGWAGPLLARVLLAMGDVDGARQAVEVAEAAPHDGMHRGFVLEARARVALEQGDAARALDDFAAAGAHMQERFFITNPNLIRWRTGAAVAAARCGDRGRALAYATEELGLARHFGAPRSIGVALRVTGTLTGGDEGLALLREAVAVLGASQARLEHVRALVDLGSALRRAGQRVAAREPLHEGLELADGQGAKPLAEVARDELKAAGGRRRRADIEASALSPTEERIARLAADGRTNRDIAADLGIAAKTVEWHLGHAYRKLGVTSRRELAALLMP